MFSQLTFNRALTLVLSVFAIFLSHASSHAVWNQPPFQDPDIGFGNVAIASDPNGNAVAATTSDNRISLYTFVGNEFVETGALTVSLMDAVLTMDLAMDASGNALFAYLTVGGDSGTLYYNGTTWFTPAFNPLSGGDDVALAMNAEGQGVLVSSTGGNIISSFFVNGAWSLPVTIGIGQFRVEVAYSSNGTAVAGWNDVGPVPTVVNYIGGVWQPSIPLDVSGNLRSVGIDAQGKALALYQSSTGDVLVKTFNGTSWQVVPTVLAGPGNSFSSLSMSPIGTAVAIWLDAALNGQSSAYNGTTWGPVMPFAAETLYNDTSPRVSVNGHGDALVIFATATFELRSARLPLGGIWQPEEIIQAVPPINRFEQLDAALSDNGRGFAAWICTTEGAFKFLNFTLLPAPPASLTVTPCKNRFATFTECVNIITWTPSPSPLISFYELSRNGVVIAQIPATGPFIFNDIVSCRRHTDIYSIIAVDSDGSESAPLFVTVTN